MSSSFRAAANTSGFVAPGAIFKFINSGGLVNFNGEFRVVSLIGTGATKLPKIAEPVSRSLSVNTEDQLAQSTAQEITLVGQFAGLPNYLEHRPGARVLAGAEASDFSDKVTIDFLQRGAVTEEYTLTVERIGSNGDITDPNTGAYSVTIGSTGERSVWYAVNDQYGNLDAIPGVNLKVSTTIGEQLGNTAVLKVVADPTEGDYLFDASNQGFIDWSPNVGSDAFGQRIGIPVKKSAVTQFDIVEIKYFDNKAHGPLATAGGVIVNPEFVADGLDNAKYRFYAVNSAQYSVDKTKDGMTSVAIKGFLQDGNSVAAVSVFDSNAPYVIDGILINLDVSAPTDEMEVLTYGSPVRVLTQRKAGMKGLEDIFSIFPITGGLTITDTVKLRVFKSDSASTGVSSGSFTVTSETTQITSAPVNVKLAQNLSTIHGCGLIAPITKIQGEDLTGWNLVLNSSLEAGSLTAPHNWVLGSNAKVAELATANQIHGTRALKLPAGSTVGDGPKVNLFKFENSNSSRNVKLSWYAASTDGTSAGAGTGIKARVIFIGASGFQVGVTTLASGHTFDGTVTRFISDTLVIPAGTITGQIVFINDSAVDAYVDAIQLEQVGLSGDVLDYHESDVATIRTTAHRTPKEPLPVISAHLALPEAKQELLKLITLDAIRGTRRVSSDWIIKKLPNDQYQVTKASSGAVTGPLDADIRYTNVIPGVALTVKSQTDDATVFWNDFETNNIAIVSTVSGINALNTIQPTTYFVNYNFRRPASEFYTVKQFLQIPDLIADLGDPTTANSLSLGGAIAFENGANIIQTVQLDEDVNFDAALEELSKVYSNIVVPMLTTDLIEGGDGSGKPTDTQYDRVTQLNFQLLDHAVLMSRPIEKKERIIISSQLPGRDIELYGAEARAANNERMVLVAPTSVIKDVKNTSTGYNDAVKIDGCFLAAAIAGLATRFDVAEPWLRKSILGFRGLGETITDSEANFLGASGVLTVGTRRTANPLDSRVAAANVAGQNGALIVSIASTTCTSGTIDQVEPSVVQIKDYVGRTVRNLLDDVYIGKKNIVENRTNVEGTTANILTSLVQSQIIVDYTGLKVSTDPTESRAIIVQFEIAPVYPINYILIEFSLIPTPSPNSNLIR
jgi:hypothetical protein